VQFHHAVPIFPEPTLLTQHPEDATAVAGDSLKLTCKESHDSNLKLSWSWDQDGTNVDSSDEHYYKAGGELQVTNFFANKLPFERLTERNRLRCPFI